MPNVGQETRLDRNRGYKNVCIFNSAEHENLSAHKYINIKKFCIFLVPDMPSMLIYLLINVKVPTIVGILTFISKIFFITSGPDKPIK